MFHTSDKKVGLKGIFGLEKEQIINWNKEHYYASDI
jgi:hypothetical protein